MRNWNLTTACFFSLSSFLAAAQGTFQNLDFESPNTAALTNSDVAFSDAFRGWTGYIGSQQATVAGYNFISAGAAAISLITPTTPGDGVIQGEYTASIVSGDAGPSLTPTPAAIAQTGSIPVWALSLRFSAFGNVNYLALTVNGVPVEFSSVAGGSNYHTYAGDIAAFAGSTAELRFTEQAAAFGPGVLLDDIQFSSTSIPEPSVLSLAALGVVLLGWPLFPSRR